MPAVAKAGRFLLLGAGLVGGLLAIALAEQGAEVVLSGAGPSSSATAISYGGVPWWAGAKTELGLLQKQAPEQWQRLEQRYGDLGLHKAELLLHWQAALGETALQKALALIPQGLNRLSGAELQEYEPLLAGAALGGGVVLPYLRLDPLKLLRGLESCYGQLGIKRRGSLFGEPLVEAIAGADHTVVCAGAQTAELLGHMNVPVPALLQLSWAGALQLPGHALKGQRVVLPLQRRRTDLEQSELQAKPTALLDAGLAPAPGGQGLLVGQTSWFECPINAAPTENQDRRALAAAFDLLLPSITEAEQSNSQWLQRPVSYSRDGLPLLGSLKAGVLQQEKPLSVCAGFSVAFALVPALMPFFAQALLDNNWGNLERLGLLANRPCPS
jgi:glycine/D-amino acid oxidase-like deaminating enzyme